MFHHPLCIIRSSTNGRFLQSFFGRIHTHIFIHNNIGMPLFIHFLDTSSSLSKNGRFLFWMQNEAFWTNLEDITACRFLKHTAHVWLPVKTHIYVRHYISTIAVLVSILYFLMPECKRCRILIERVVNLGSLSYSQWEWMQVGVTLCFHLCCCQLHHYCLFTVIVTSIALSLRVWHQVGHSWIYWLWSELLG